MPHQPVLPAGPPGAFVMDGALLPGVRVDIVLALDMRGDLVFPVWTTRWIDDPGIVPPLDRTKVTSASVKAWIL